MNKPTLLVFAVFLFFSASINAQDNSELKKAYSLRELINIARRQSIASKQAETTRENRFWQFQSYRSNYKPQLALDGMLPGYNRTFSPVTQEDGTIRFRPLQSNNSDINLSIRQDIAPTGTRLFLNSGIARFDNFLDEPDLGLEPYRQYSGNPIELIIMKMY